MRLLALMVVLALSGCLNVTQTTSSTTSECDTGNLQDAPESCQAPPAPPGKYEVVDISDSGDLNGASQSWTWTTEPNATVFDVRVEVTGPAGSPLFTLNDFEFTLVGGPDGSMRMGSSGTGTTSIQSGTSVCMVCYDGRGQMDNYGTWVLTVRAGTASAGTWDVMVKTRYA